MSLTAVSFIGRRGAVVETAMLGNQDCRSRINTLAAYLWRLFHKRRTSVAQAANGGIMPLWAASARSGVLIGACGASDLDIPSLVTWGMPPQALVGRSTSNVLDLFWCA